MASLKDLTEADVVALSEAAGEPDWLRDTRQEAFKALADIEWPHSKIEEWRYTDPRRIDVESPLAQAGGDAEARSTGIVDASTPAATLRIVDGAVSDVELSEEAVSKGVIVSDLATAATAHADLVRESLGGIVRFESAYTAANLAAFTVGAFVHVPADVALEAPIAVTHQVTSGGTHVPRILVSFGSHSRADVFIEHSGDAEATVVEVVEVAAASGAAGRVVSVQDWGSDVTHVAWHRAQVGRNADVKCLEATFGGKVVYVRPDVHLAGEGGNGELFGVYYGSGTQHFEHRSLIHHDASHTSSDSVYKGALQGNSNAVWYGNIRIEPHAKATVSDETNRNLILTDGAHADSIPWLEILTSDVVGCGHHSSVGQVDPLQLFYLESKGIPRPEAARMLLFGFFKEVLDRVDLDVVTETVLAVIESGLKAAPTALVNPRKG